MQSLFNSLSAIFLENLTSHHLILYFMNHLQMSPATIYQMITHKMMTLITFHCPETDHKNFIKSVVYVYLLNFLFYYSFTPYKSYPPKKQEKYNNYKCDPFLENPPTRSKKIIEFFIPFGRVKPLLCCVKRLRLKW